MKKTYITPNIILVKTDLESAMLEASDPNFNPGMGGSGANTGDITSKNHRPGYLWDESWEDLEEDEEN